VGGLLARLQLHLSQTSDPGGIGLDYIDLHVKPEEATAIRKALLTTGWGSEFVTHWPNTGLTQYRLTRLPQMAQAYNEGAIKMTTKTETTSATTKLCNTVDIVSAMIAAGWIHSNTTNDHVSGTQTTYFVRVVPA
jgi:hypothetical protein